MGKIIYFEICIILLSLFFLAVVIVFISLFLRGYEKRLNKVLEETKVVDKSMLCLASEKSLEIGIIWNKTSSISNVLNIGVSLSATILLLILGISSTCDKLINLGGIVSNCISTIVLCSILVFCIGKNDILIRYQKDIQIYASNKKYDEILNDYGIKSITLFFVFSSMFMSMIIMVLNLSYLNQLIMFILWCVCVIIKTRRHILLKKE